MPEIKNIFRQGVMNKDDDERIIPNGQYRDAMNIEVSTSEDSEVGTVQNILGNTLQKSLGGAAQDFVCVGAIADEKNDTMYWFVASPSKDMILEYHHDGTTTPVLVDVNKNVLEFDRQNIITGVNIIDDLLFWTDNINEPKKINIKSCKQGTFNENTQTSLIVNGVNQGDIKLENVTVIKKKPTKSPDVSFKESTIQPLTILPNLNFFNLNVFDIIENVIVGDDNNIVPAAFLVGDIVLASLTTLGLTTGIYDVKLKVLSADPVLGTGTLSSTTVGTNYKFEIVEINVGVYQDDLNQDFKAIKKIDNEAIFKKDFVRFATRYKYVDGEYSAFSPFTQPVFLAGRFGFHPTKDPYNLGMENRTINILLNNLIETNTPKDVVQLDILFKKERSTTIYTVDSIKPDDEGSPNPWNTNDFPNNAILSWSGSSLQSSTVEKNPTGQYEINIESIYAALPENQLLRPYDNVPRKALAQEITGNRLVFANYVQNYNMIKDNGQYAKQDILVRREQRSFDIDGVVSFPENKGKKSIKSLRTYYLGIVYGDEFGRETPVFTSKNASINIPFDNDESGTNDIFNADKSLRLKARLVNQPPEWASYFKYYIKQTTGEYHNLTMDRVYKTTGDENLWISFPSSDRNKIETGDYFSIKKQVDKELIVPVENKIKIIAIANEAPESIKFNFQPLGTANGTQAVLDSLFVDPGRRPLALKNNFVVDKSEFVNVHGGIAIDEALTPSDRLAVQFSITAPSGNGVIRSKVYLVTSFGVENPNSNQQYHIILKDKIEEADAWINDANGNLNATDGLNFILLKVVEKDATEFEGRFFVKIISSPITQQYLIPSISDLTNFSLQSIVPYFTLINNISNSAINPLTCKNAVIPQNVGSYTDTQGDFAFATTFGTGSNNNSAWFVDALGFIAAQQDDPTLIDADKSGKMYKGNPAISVNQYVNGLEGVISFPNGITSPYNQSGAGSTRTWSNNAYRLVSDRKISSDIENLDFVGNSGGFTNTYNSSQSTPHFLHLSYMAPGTDLHDGDFTVIENYFDGIPTVNTQTWFDLYDALFSKEMLQKIYATDIYQQKLNPGTNTVAGPNLPNLSPNQFFYNVLSNDPIVGNATMSNKWAYVSSQHTINPGFNLPNLSNLDSSDPDWIGCFDPIYNNANNVPIVNSLQQGKRFTIEGDDNTVYTILKVTKHLLYNHTAWNPVVEYDSSGAKKSYLLSNVFAQGPGSPTVAGAMQEFANHFAGNLGSPNINNASWSKLKDTVVNFGRANNRRVLFVLELDKDPRSAGSSTGNIFTSDAGNGAVSDNISSKLNFVEDYIETGSNTIPTSPAIFETEAKEDVDLNIYYEASDNIPIKVTESSDDFRGNLLAPIGTKVLSEIIGADPTDWVSVNETQGTENLFLKVKSWDGNTLELTPPGLVHGTAGLQDSDYIGSRLRFVREDGSYTEARILEITVSNNKIFSLKIIPNIYNQFYGLPYYNCFSFGNGVESNRIRDDFNESFILNGVKASSVLEETYEEEHRKYGLIFSGLYNSISGVNNLNQFIQAEKITKDVNPTFGSIQKLYSRTKDLVTLCEDKVLQIFVDRDLLFNADGKQQLLTSDKFLGTTQPFAGNYGISKNPESFAAESFRAYFTDKQRGAVLRLSRDGLTPISEAGMADYFRDELKSKDVLYGSYDAYKKDYNLSMLKFNSLNLIENSEFTTGTFNQVTLDEELLNNSFDDQTTTNVTLPTYDMQNVGTSQVPAIGNDYIQVFTNDLPVDPFSNQALDLTGLYISAIDIGNDGTQEYAFQGVIGNIIVQAQVTSMNVGGTYTQINFSVVETITNSIASLSDMVLSANFSTNGADLFRIGPLIPNLSITNTDNWNGINSNNINNNSGTIELSDGDGFNQPSVNLDPNKLYRVEVVVAGGPMWTPGTTNTPILLIDNQVFNISTDPNVASIPGPGTIIDDMTGLSGSVGFVVTGGSLNIESISIKELVPQGGTVLNWDLYEGLTEDGELEFLLNPRRVAFSSTSTDLKRLSQIITNHDIEQNVKYRLKFKILNYQGGTLKPYLRGGNPGFGIDFASINSNGNFNIADVVSASNTTLDPLPNTDFISSLKNRIIFETTDFIGDIDNVELYVDGFDGTTVTFNEKSKGWTSFKSFVPEIAISSVNQYYSMLFGELWKHHTNQTRNTFYNVFTESSVTPVLNLRPELVKHFNTLNYEGTESRIDANSFDNEYYNLNSRKGWYVNNVFTNKQEGTVNEFIEKEGKWYNYIKGTQLHVDTSAFNFQGLGVVKNVLTQSNLTSSTPTNDEVILMGCTDPNAINYNPAVTVDDGSCIYLTDNGTAIDANGNQL